jgi:hypothetical protein
VKGLDDPVIGSITHMGYLRFPLLVNTYPFYPEAFRRWVVGFLGGGRCLRLGSSFSSFAGGEHLVVRLNNMLDVIFENFGDVNIGG